MMSNTDCGMEQELILSWDKRLHEALDRYAKIDGIQPESISALAEGLRGWAEILPCSSQGNDGRYLPVNTWGLGAEYTEIYALVDWLILQNRSDLANSLSKKFEALHQTAKAIDANYPKISLLDEATEKRLVKICQRQTAQLIHFLVQLIKKIFTHNPNRLDHSCAEPAIRAATSHRKRSHRAANIELLENALIEHIKSARDYAWASVDADKGPLLLPRPLKKELAKQTRITLSSVSRCFDDPSAHQLRCLWETAVDLEQILRFKKR